MKANPYPDCGHEEPHEHPKCEHCWWNQTHDVDDEGNVTDLYTGRPRFADLTYEDM